MGDHEGAARAIIISPQAAIACRHITQGVGAVVLRKDDADYTPNSLGWVRWTDRDGIDREDAEQNFSITLRTEFGMDISTLTPSRQFPLAAVEKLATVQDGDVVLIDSRATKLTVSCKVTRGTPDGAWTIELDYVPLVGDSGSIVTFGGVFVGWVSAGENGRCIVSVPPIPAPFPGEKRHEGKDDPIPDPILVPTNPTSPYTPPPGSSTDFKSGVIWERNRAFTAAQKRLVAEFNEALAAI
jgi:hypothetical protein